MSPREAPIKVLHLYLATAAVLVGMAGMAWTDGNRQGETNSALRTMNVQMEGLRLDVKTLAQQVQHGETLNAVQDKQLFHLENPIPSSRIYVPPGRSMDR